MSTPTWHEGWWEEAFPLTRSPSEIAGHPRGKFDMKIVVAYDITNPKRLKKIADVCLNYGIRIQYSIFECRLTTQQFEEMWKKLTAIALPDEDRLVAYPLFAKEEKQVRTYGQMVTNDAVVAYIF